MCVGSGVRGAGWRNHLGEIKRRAVVTATFQVFKELTFFFLAAPHRLRDLSSPTRD